MSDMPASRPTPDASAHEQHDGLLIAQLVAGDPIDDAQRLAAQRLVATCRECAVLAADLGAISRAVAWEPIPARRRDFRFDPERAAELRGSRVQRLLRRLSLPQAAALRPVAAGVLSVGLLFVVAGTVWPEDSPVSPGAPPPQLEDRAPAVMESVGPGAPEDAARRAEEQAGSVEPLSPLPIFEMEAQDVDTPGAASTGEQPVEGEQNAAKAAPTGALDRSIADDPAPAGAPESQDGVSAAAAAEAFSTSEELAAEASPAVQAPASADASGAVDTPAAETSGAVDAAAADTSRAVDAAAADTSGAAASSRVGDTNTAAEARPSADLFAVTQESSAADVAQPAGDAADGTLGATGDGVGMEDLLLTAGVVLAVLGAILLVLTWLGRRAADPLLR